MTINDFFTEERYLENIGFYLKRDSININIESAGEILRRGFEYFLKEEPKWILAYNEVADWLKDNKGRGLLCMGNVGLGKSLLCAKIMPIVFHYYGNRILPVYNATDINSRIDEIKKNKLFVLDDIGVEGVSVQYGNRRNAFVEIVDWCERSGALLIATTNLTTDQLAEKYGERTMDRLRSITRKVVFAGKSFRQ